MPEQGDVAMTHLSTFDGLLGFATLHPLLTLGPVLIGVAATDSAHSCVRSLVRQAGA